MASPVFHGLAGAGLAYAMAGDARLPLFASLRKLAPLGAAAAVLACLPDVDYLPGLWRGYLNTTHQQITHSFAWIFLVVAGIWLLGRTWKPERFGWRAAAFILILLASHLAVDLVSEDRLAPYGFPLWAPFSGATVPPVLNLLPAWDKTALADLGSWGNLRALAIEFGAGLAFFAGCVAAKTYCGRRRAPSLPTPGKRMHDLEGQAPSCPVRIAADESKMGNTEVAPPVSGSNPVDEKQPRAQPPKRGWTRRRAAL